MRIGELDCTYHGLPVKCLLTQQPLHLLPLMVQLLLALHEGHESLSLVFKTRLEFLVLHGQQRHVNSHAVSGVGGEISADHLGLIASMAELTLHLSQITDTRQVLLASSDGQHCYTGSLASLATLRMLAHHFICRWLYTLHRTYTNNSDAIPHQSNRIPRVCSGCILHELSSAV